MAATNINRVNLSGNIATDPDHRTTTSDVSVVSFRLAVNSRRKNPNTGDWYDHADFFDVEAWEKQADFVKNYLGKGSPIIFDGRARVSAWEDNDGKRKSRVVFVADRIQSTKGGGGQSERGPHPADEFAGDGEPQAEPETDPLDDAHDELAGEHFKPQESLAGGGSDDDDIPF